MSMTDLAKRLNLTQPAISIAARRGERIVRENQYMLIDGYLFMYLWMSPCLSLGKFNLKNVSEEVEIYEI